MNSMKKEKKYKKNKPSILLTYPPASIARGWDKNHFPMTQLLLASFLEQEGLRADIYHEFPYSIPQILNLIKRHRPLAFGMTCDCANLQSCAQLAAMVKASDRNIYVILGGVHATLYHRDILEHFPQFDIIIRGEGEVPLAETLSRLDHLDTTIKGITFRKNASLEVNSEQLSPLDCNKLPNLSYHLLGEAAIKNFEFTNKWWPLHSGRGCCFNCTFCASGRFWEYCYRVKDPKCLVEEIIYCQRHYQARRFSFDDLVFSVNRKRIHDLCEELRHRQLKIEWCCDTRVDCVDKQLLKTMWEAGCRRILYGVESFSDKILKLMNKNYTGTRALEMVNFSKDLGMQTKCHVIFGFPGETETTLKETLDHIHRLRTGIFCNPIIFHMYTGTDIYDMAKKQGLVKDKWWLSGYSIDDFTHRYYSPRFLRKLFLIRDKIQHQFKKYAD